MSKQRQLSSSMSRAEVITAFRRKYVVAPPVDAVVPDAPTSDSVDTELTTQIATLKAALEAVKATQAKDPDDNTDPNDAKVDAAITQLETALAALEAAQDADATEDATEPTDSTPVADPSDVKAAKLAVTDVPDTEINPQDTEGNVDPDAICATDGCGHVASMHGDTGTGDNTGVCSTPDCLCEQMTFATNDATGAVTPVDGGPDNAGGTDTTDANLATRGGEFADGVVAPADESTPDAPDEGINGVSADDELNLPPEMAGGSNMGPAFTIPVAIIEGQPTGDGRDIALNSLSWGPPPYALMGLATSTHDPMGYDLNDPAVLVGRIDSFERAPGEGSTNIIVGKGFFLSNDDGMYFADLLEGMGRLPVSGDVTVDSSEVTAGEIDEQGWPTNITETLTAGTLTAVTILPFGPAFEGAYIVLGDGAEPTPIAVTSDQLPPVPAALAAAGQIVHWLALEDCVPCDSGIDVLVASGGPMKPPKSWFDAPNFTEDDGRLLPFIAKGERGKMITGYACPPTVTEDGEVFGHIAPWGVCHVGQMGKCVVAPHSAVDYAHYRRGAHVVTAEGDVVRVGVITANTGHADLKLGARASMDHYDNTAFQAADVVVGEDEYGIWYHGALRPDATESQVRMLRASALSGDWREIGGNLELVAALAVNQPGFPMAVTAGGQLRSLVASGAWAMFKLGHPELDELDAEEAEALMKLSHKPLLRLVRKDARERLGVLAKAEAKFARQRIDAL